MINPSHFNIENELNDAYSRWSSFRVLSLSPLLRLRKFTHMLSVKMTLQSQKKSPHMAVQPHLVRNVESKLKETGNFALRSPVKA